MNEDERKLITETMNVMHGLRSEMQEFRGEMKEFKQTAVIRITGLEAAANECQKNPAVCANARALDAHLKDHKGNKGLAVSIWAVCVSTVMCAFTIVMALMKRS